jgi:glycosyltransferase involved in cell wall biosynthesis
MKILWVKTDYLHPTTKGGHIRTLEMLKCLNRRHEVHYLALGRDLAQDPKGEGPRRATEYARQAADVGYQTAGKRSVHFAWELVRGLVDPVPVAVRRYDSAALRRRIGEQIARERYDHVICDFLAPAPNFARLEDCILFQHNVESMIWERHASTATHPLKRWYFQGQADRMSRYEAEVCRRVRHVIAVSEEDARQMRERFGLAEVSWVPTGVDLDYFAPPAPAEPRYDLVFVGSLDWMPNRDGLAWFRREIYPILRRERPDLRIAIVGREPDASLKSWAAEESGVTVTGTVPDVRPYLWAGQVSIVPLRIGGGTRLKIFEAMAAQVPVVSTTIGAEGLAVQAPEHIRLEDEPGRFAAACLELLNQPAERQRQALSGRTLVEREFSWDTVARRFESILEEHRG